ncbi:MAG TPA: cytochrome c oxidase subunit 3 [Caulobacteraceae bacterium]|jgi:heme/copper-type cytochrome/quinol oxidase subunit 3|nr:cytochrome c oxidase subunit 3 [Caulobacteraceae bacterium]
MTEVVLDPGPLPVGPYDKKGPGWWGVLSLIATEAALFTYLLFSYYFYDLQLPHSWRPAEPPKLNLSAPDTLVLLVSSAAVWFAERSLKKGSRSRAGIGILVGLILGAIFVVVQIFEWKSKTFTPQTSVYGSIYFTITTFHLAHVLVGLLALLFVLIWIAFGYFDNERHAAVSNVVIYWHFVDVVWLFIFSTFYITPYLW